MLTEPMDGACRGAADFKKREGAGKRLRRALQTCASVLALLSFPINMAAAAEGEFLKVIILSDQTIRQVAEEYLSDPDLWPEILRTSGINSIADLQPGMELLIPVTEVTEANKALLESLGQIQKANLAGAQIFAPKEIGEAVNLHAQALQKRLERQWVTTKDLAVASFKQATTALELSASQRDQAAEALVSDRTGEVEGQRPEDLSWRDLQLLAILVEEEKVRTLSGSTAQITFRDASRLRLNANSNAIIKEMRFDPLKRTQEAKVTLVEGDFYALLAGGENDRTKFNVEIPQVNATIDSGDFWVSNNDDTAKFTNYDDAVVNVAANGETVTLGKNQGTVVDKGETPKAALAVLPPPVPAAPANDGVVFVTAPELSWAPVDGSAGYWLEVASDQGFQRIVTNQFGIEAPKHVMEALAVGEYFWRVSALDGFGLPGERSPTWRFSVTPDNTAPFLQIDKPVEGVIIREASVEISGESEPGTTLTIGGEAVTVGPDGKFALTITPAEGDNAIAVVATDPAGNKTSRERRFAYMPDHDSVVAFDPAIRTIAPLHFVTNGNVISLSGKTTANTEVEIRAGVAVRASAATGGDGLFRINVPLSADEEKLAFAVIAPSGFTTVEDFAVTIDRVAPAIALDEILPRLTAEPKLRVAGKTEAGATLTLNGYPVALADGRFDVGVTLTPGPNTMELIATDAAGNVVVEKSSVRLDREPPQLLSSRATPATNGGAQVLSLEVAASDDSGLAKAAPFTVIAGAEKFTGYLRYNKAAKTYQGFIVIPEAALAAAKLSAVELQDDAGNTKTFDIQ